MTVLFTDDYVRPDAGNLGGNYTPNPHESVTDGLIVSGFHAIANNLFNDTGSLITGITLSTADYSVEVTFTATHADGVGTGYGCASRSSSSQLTRYRSVGNASGYEFGKFINGTFTSLSSGTGATFTAADKLRLDFLGTTWTLKKNGTQFATGSDASVSAAGNAEVLYSSTASTSDGISLVTVADFSGAAALAGNATASASSTSALTTAIRLAGAPASVSTAVGFLMGLMANAGVNSAGSASLTTAIQMAASAFATNVVSAALVGNVQLGAGAISAVSAAAVLTNWTTVTLTAPLYTGQGGAIDPHFWVDSVPTVGTVLSYDHTHITIAPDGQITSDVQDCTAIVQFFDGANWAVGIIRLTSGLAAYADLATVATSSLSTGILLLAAANMLVQATAALNSQIKLQGAVQAVVLATAALSNAIQLLGAATDDSSASGTLAGTVQSLAANAAVTSTATAFLNAHINLIAAASALVSATGALSAQIVFQASANSSSSASGTLVTGTPMSAAAQAAIAATAALLTAIRMAGPVLVIAQAGANLTNHIDLLAAAVSQSTVTGALTTFTGLQSNAQSIASATGSLLALVSMQASAFSISQADADLLTAIPLQGGVLVTDSAAGTLTATGSAAGLYPLDPFFVIGTRRQYYTQQFPEIGPGEARILTFNFADDLAIGETLEGIISVGVTASAGTDTGLPGSVLVAPAAYNTALNQVQQPIQGAVNDDDYYFTVTAHTNNPNKVLTRFGLLSVRA